MSQVKSEQQVLQEGFEILLSHMAPSDIARFLTACAIGKGDYLKLKDELFAQDSVDSLYANIQKYEASKQDVE